MDGTQMVEAAKLLQYMRDEIGHKCEVCLSSYLDTDDGQTKVRFIIYAMVNGNVCHYTHTIDMRDWSRPNYQAVIIEAIIRNAQLGINQPNHSIFWPNLGDYHEPKKSK